MSLPPGIEWDSIAPGIETVINGQVYVTVFEFECARDEYGNVLIADDGNCAKKMIGTEESATYAQGPVKKIINYRLDAKPGEVARVLDRNTGAVIGYERVQDRRSKGFFGDFFDVAGDFLKESPFLQFAAVMPTPVQPFAAAASAALNKNPLALVASVAGITGFETVAAGARFASAIESDNPLAIVSSGIGLGQKLDFFSPHVPVIETPQGIPHIEAANQITEVSEMPAWDTWDSWDSVVQSPIPTVEPTFMGFDSSIDFLPAPLPEVDGWYAQWDEPPKMDFGTADAAVEPPPVSWGGEEVFTMDRPPYEYGGATFQPAPQMPSVAPPLSPTAPTQSFAQTIKEISGAAMAAIGVVKAWEARQLPPNTVARATRPDGSVVTARSNGTIVTRDTRGRVTVGRPEVGLPQSTDDGFVVINNGDGSYTRISPQGQRETIRYPGGTIVPSGGPGGVSAISGGVILALGAAGVAFLVMRKKR